MDDTISRQAAIELLYQYPFEEIVNCISILEEMPSVDAVPVIRCKDCKHWNPFWKSCYEYDDAMMPPEHFCSFAERKEE